MNNMICWNDLQKEISKNIEEKIMNGNTFTTMVYSSRLNYGQNFLIGSSSNKTNEKSKSKTYKDLIPERIIVNKRTTIVYFPDGEKILVRCAENEEFQIETAVAEAITKKVFGGNRSAFLKVVDQTYYQPENNEKKSNNIE
jgi:hypothetical protein